MTDERLAMAPPHDLVQRIRELHNDNVKWDGTYVGLLPSLAGVQLSSFMAAGDAAIPLLIEALHDPNQFVAAHVLLTQLSGVVHATAPWNGLCVELNANGTVQIDTDQRFDLARRWQSWWQAPPHSNTLPE